MFVVVGGTWVPGRREMRTGMFYGDLRGTILLKVTASVLWTFVHREVRWSDRIVVIDHKLIVVQARIP